MSHLIKRLDEDLTNYQFATNGNLKKSVNSHIRFASLNLVDKNNSDSKIFGLQTPPRRINTIYYQKTESNLSIDRLFNDYKAEANKIVINYEYYNNLSQELLYQVLSSKLPPEIIAIIQKYHIKQFVQDLVQKQENRIAKNILKHSSQIDFYFYFNDNELDDKIWIEKLQEIDEKVINLAVANAHIWFPELKYQGESELRAKVERMYVPLIKEVRNSVLYLLKLKVSLGNDDKIPSIEIYNNKKLKLENEKILPTLLREENKYRMILQLKTLWIDSRGYKFGLKPNLQKMGLL